MGVAIRVEKLGKNAPLVMIGVDEVQGGAT